MKLEENKGRLNVNSRDTLLIRLDERSSNTWRAIEKIEKHLEKLNNNVESHTIRIAVNRRWLIVLTAIGSGLILTKLTGVL